MTKKSKDTSRQVKKDVFPKKAFCWHLTYIFKNTKKSAFFHFAHKPNWTYTMIVTMTLQHLHPPGLSV